MPRKPPAPNPSPKRVDPWVARPSPLLAALAARFHLTAWEQEYGGECFTVTASDRVGQKPTVSIDGLHRDHCKEDTANTARVVRVLRELADLIERCEAEAGPAPGTPDVGSAAEYGAGGTAGTLAQAAIAGATAGLMAAVTGSALARFSPGNAEDDDDDDQGDDEPPTADQQLAELQLLIEEEALAELPPGCEWKIQRENLPDEPGPALLLLDARPNAAAGHVGDGRIFLLDSDACGRDWHWEMCGTASCGVASTPEAASVLLAGYAWGRVPTVGLEPAPKGRVSVTGGNVQIGDHNRQTITKRKGRPPGSKNRPKSPPPEQAALPESGPEPPPPDPSPAAEPTHTPGQAILERWEAAGGSLDPRILPAADAEAIGEATAKGWLRPLESGGTVVLMRLTDAGWEELERMWPGGTLGRFVSKGEP